jgi:tellurite resistance protein
MRLADEIAAAGLTPAMRRVFTRGLRAVARADGALDEPERRAIEVLLGGSLGENAPREPLESIWPHAELFVRACIHVALVDGHYRVEEARAVGKLAHRLGLSVQRLEALERQVFAKLEAAARALPYRPSERP